MGMGLMMPAMFAQYFGGQKTGGGRIAGAGRILPGVPAAHVPADAKFCPQCGHQKVVFSSAPTAARTGAERKVLLPLRPGDGNRAPEEILPAMRRRKSGGFHTLQRVRGEAVTASHHDHLSNQNQCPQCGAPADLEETDRLFACPFCRVTSLLLTRDYFRYVLPARNPGRQGPGLRSLLAVQGDSAVQPAGRGRIQVHRCEPLRHGCAPHPGDPGPAQPGPET